MRDEWHEAVRGQGAFLNGERVAPPAAARLDEVLVAFGFGYDRGGTMEATLAAVTELARKPVLGVRRFGSAALDLAFVGLGKCGAFFEYELNLWDFAAGRLFVEEAGGRVTDCRGDPLPLSQSSILATRGVPHEAILESRPCTSAAVFVGWARPTSANSNPGWWAEPTLRRPQRP